MFRRLILDAESHSAISTKNMNHIEGNTPAESIIERLRREYPDERQLPLAAMAGLKDPVEIRQFMVEYSMEISRQLNPEENGDEYNPMVVANANTSYWLVHCGPDTISRWKDAIEGLEHPYFGRDF